MGGVPDTALTAPGANWLAPTAHAPIRQVVRLPGSKSMTARALVLAAVSVGSSTLRHPLRARDTELMAAGLRLDVDRFEAASLGDFRARLFVLEAG